MSSVLKGRHMNSPRCSRGNGEEYDNPKGLNVIRSKTTTKKRLMFTCYIVTARHNSTPLGLLLIRLFFPGLSPGAIHIKVLRTFKAGTTIIFIKA